MKALVLIGRRIDCPNDGWNHEGQMDDYQNSLLVVYDQGNSVTMHPSHTRDSYGMDWIWSKKNVTVLRSRQC
jgi:hypothetical protein